jgi:SAM-dependent methyltransferase
VGLDWDRPALRRAEVARRRLGLANLAFVRSDFAEPGTGPVFDVVLSVCSAHYVTDPVVAMRLFTALASCLRPGGRLLLYGPRCISEAPFVGWLRRPVWHQVYSAGQLRTLCQAAGLRVDSLDGRIGRAGTVAKQLDWQWQGNRRRAALAVGLYWVEMALAAADRGPVDGTRMRTLMWLLVASKE